MATMTQKAQAVPPMRIEQVPIGSLTPHSRNFRSHPPTQLEHLQQSLREYGWARNVVVSRDNVILAGHGIVEAARKEGHTTVPVLRLALKGDDPKAEKFLALENTVSRLAVDDDTQLAALLADVQRTEGLEGTGYTDADLDALIAEMAGSGFAEGLAGYGMAPDKLPNTGFHFALTGPDAERCEEALQKAVVELGSEVDGLLPVDAKSKAFLLICEAYLA
ncbi:MAG: ParB N-terminal domain-containing protein [Veillonellaceae bacterium]|nr:ParB N-terminal domain-containing protein [Veillonellaceae bacterium]